MVNRSLNADLDKGVQNWFCEMMNPIGHRKPLSLYRAIMQTTALHEAKKNGLKARSHHKDEKKMKLRALVLLPVFVVGEKSVGPNIIEQDEKQTNKNRRLLESIEKTF